MIAQQTDLLMHINKCENHRRFIKTCNMKWLLSLLCFISISAFSQTDKPLLEKLKTTQEQLKGKSFDDIPNPALDFQRRTKKPPVRTGENILPPLTLGVPETGIPGPGKIPNAARRSDSKPRVTMGNVESMVLALPQDNMPCIVPNMKLYRLMPGVNEKTIAENQKPYKLLQPKPKS